MKKKYSLDQLLLLAIAALSTMQVNKIFTVSELFEKNDWDMIPVFRRANLGRSINRYMESRNDEFLMIGKNNRKQTQYMKIGECIIEKPSSSQLLQTAIRTLSELESGETFKVMDLFRGFEWRRIPKGTRFQLGGLFSNHAKNQTADLKFIEKTTGNQQQYIKISHT